ncbi:MAG: radical SAM protein [Candidatus Methanoplasma sp.]|jgi:biotin synthase-related radical SAM superfamily protein|nr:radical SAM protein [Candidatus Methanoplasma sp.]
MEEDVNIRKKAELSLGGGIKLPQGFVMPYRLSRSTAGPGAGSTSAVFTFGKYRVKKGISYEAGEFELHDNNGVLSLTRNGEPFLDSVQIRPVVYHCPEQAFFNLDQRCIFNCAYCASPRLDKKITKGLTDEMIVDMVKDAMETKDVLSISLTSGVVGSIEETVDKMVSCVKALRSEFPDKPIGVEPYVSKAEQIRALKDAGADEIKINIEASTKELFEKVCPELDFDGILEMLDAAVPIFGRGTVTSNIIFGLGETDEELCSMIDNICSRDVIPTLRALRYNPYNGESLKAAIGNVPKVDPDRAISTARMLKEYLEKYNLDSKGCHTMCIECTCCDLVPFRDL